MSRFFSILARQKCQTSGIILFKKILRNIYKSSMFLFKIIITLGSFLSNSFIIFFLYNQLFMVTRGIDKKITCHHHRLRRHHHLLMVKDQVEVQDWDFLLNKNLNFFNIWKILQENNLNLPKATAIKAKAKPK